MWLAFARALNRDEKVSCGEIIYLLPCDRVSSVTCSDGSIYAYNRVASGASHAACSWGGRPQLTPHNILPLLFDLIDLPVIDT